MNKMKEYALVLTVGVALGVCYMMGFQEISQEYSMEWKPTETRGDIP